MDMNENVFDMLVQTRLAEMRADAARHNAVAAARPASRPLRVALGLALVRLGSRLAGGFTAVRATA